MNIHPYISSESDDFYHIWEACFGDSQDVIDEFLDAFSGNIREFTLTGQDDQVCAALTQFHMGSLFMQSSNSSVPDASAFPVQISYAIGTDPLQRGHGYGSAITQYAAEQAETDGSLSVLSPADQGLVNFYRPLHYIPFFYKEELTAEAAGHDQNIAEMKMHPVLASEYNQFREEFLSGRPHIRLSDQALAYETLCTGAEPPEGSPAVSDHAAASPADSPAENTEEGHLPSSGFFRCTAPLSCICSIEPAEDDDLLYIPELLTEDEEKRDSLSNFLSLLAAFFHKSHAFCMTPAGRASETALVHGMVHIPEIPEAGAGTESAGAQNISSTQELAEAIQIIRKTDSRQPLPAWLGFAFD